MRMVATQANGQPAFGLYMRTEAGDFEPFHLQVLTIAAEGSATCGSSSTSTFREFGLRPHWRHERACELTIEPSSHGNVADER